MKKHKSSSWMKDFIKLKSIVLCKDVLENVAFVYFVLGIKSWRITDNTTICVKFVNPFHTSGTFGMTVSSGRLWTQWGSWSWDQILN